MKYFVAGLTRVFDSFDLAVALGFAFEASANCGHSVAVTTSDNQVVAVVSATLSGFRPIDGLYIVHGCAAFEHINRALHAAWDAAQHAQHVVPVHFNSLVRLNKIAEVTPSPYALRA
jgi:hypothetical protein